MATATAFNDEYFYTKLSMATKFGHSDNYILWAFPRLPRLHRNNSFSLYGSLKKRNLFQDKIILHNLTLLQVHAVAIKPARYLKHFGYE